MRSPSTVAVAGLAAVLAAWALFLGQGNTAPTWLGFGALVGAGALTVGALLARLPSPTVDGWAVAFVACFAGLVLWEGVSILWSVQPDVSWDGINRGLVYLAFLCVGMFLGAVVPRAPRTIAIGLAALLGAALAYALLAKMIPALYDDYGRLARLRSPVAYWNALALVADFGLALGLWLARWRRIEAALLVFSSTLCVLLTYSRGGLLVFALVALSWLAYDRARSALPVLVGGAGGVVVATVSLALPGITDDGTSHSTRVHDGAIFAALVVGTAAVVALVAGRVQLPARAVRGLLALAGAGALAAGVVVALQSDNSRSGPHCVQGASRFACSSSDERLDWWKQSLDVWRERPFIGSGAETFGRAHALRRSTFVRATTEPHNLALQTLSETGIVGFALFVGAAVAAAVAVVRRVRREEDAAIALAIVAGAWLAHSLIDIDWEFVAVTGTMFLVLGSLLARPGPPAGRPDTIWAAGAAALVLTAVLSVAAPFVAQRKLDDAAAAPSNAAAAAFVSQAHAWNPVSSEILYTWAAYEEARGQRLRALQLYHEAVDTQPDDPEAHAQLGLAELRFGDTCSAYRDLNDTYTLDPFNPIAVRGGPLDRTRAAVNRGACG